jgi:hypothetical protein
MANRRQITTPMIERLVTGPTRPESNKPAMITAPRKVASVSQYVEGVTQVVRRDPLAGLENIATMKASATGITAEPKPLAGGTGESGTRVKTFGIDAAYYAAASSSGIAVTT